MAQFARGNPARWWKSRSCGSVSRAPGSLFISPLRKYAGLATLSFFLLGFVALCYITNSTRISRLSEGMLSKALGGHVTVKGGHLSLSGTLLLSGVEVRTSDPEPTPGADVPIFTAQQIEVRFDWISLLSGQLSATQLVATTPVFRPIEDRESGHWNYERLRPPAGSAAAIAVPSGAGSSPLPVVMVRGARVVWGEVRNGLVQQTGETIIDGQLTPDSTAASLYRLLFTESAPAAPLVDGLLPAATGHDPDRRGDVGVMLHGTWDVAKNIFNVSADNVVMSDALKRGMPRQAREWCEAHQLDGRLAQLNTTFNPQDGLILSVHFDNVSMMWMVEPEQGIGMGEERPAYPLAVSNVRGSVIFSLSSGSIKINDVSGEALGYQFTADCALNGSSFEAPFEMNLRFPGAVLSDPYPPLFMAFLTGQDLIQRIHPLGKVDIAIAMKRLVAHGPMSVTGTIDCHDAGIRFAHLPYPLDHLNGRISFDQKSVTFEDVTARSDENSVRIKGTTGTTWNNPMVDFLVSSDDTVFDDRLGACLPEKFAAVWNLFSVRGHGSFVCRVTRSSAIFDIPKVSVDVDLDDGYGYIRSLPYVFSHAQGHLHFEADQSRIEHFTAVAGPGMGGKDGDPSGHVALDGVVYHPGGDVTNLRPDLHLTADIPINAALFKAFPEALAAKLKGVQLAGRMGFQGTIRHGAASATPSGDATATSATGSQADALQVAGKVQWTDGTLATTLAGVPVNFHAINAQALLQPGSLDLTRFEGTLQAPSDAGFNSQETVQIQSTGKLDFATMAAAIELNADSDALTLPAHPYVWFPKVLSDAWTTYSPSGKIGLQASAALHIHAPAPNQTGLQSFLSVDTYNASIIAKDIALKPPGWPDSPTHLAGTVELRPGFVGMKAMSGKLGDIDLAWNGQLHTQTGQASLQGDAVSHGLPLKWLSFLPTQFVQSLDAKHEGTQLTLHFDDLRREGRDTPWSFDGTLATKELAVVEPMAMSSARANLVVQGTYAPAAGGKRAALDFSGVMAGTNIVISDRLIDTVTARVDVVAADNSIHITEIDGKVAGGSLTGRIHIDTGSPAPDLAATQAATAPAIAAPPPGPGGYQAELSLSDANLANLLLPANSTEEERNKVGTGRVSASLTLDQRFRPVASGTGGAEAGVAVGAPATATSRCATATCTTCPFPWDLCRSPPFGSPWPVPSIRPI